jgi:hypothetical protein
VLSFASLNHPVLAQNFLLKPYSFTMSLSAQLTIAFVNATDGTVVKYCTVRPLGLQVAKKAWWLHTDSYYHPDMGCLFWCDDTLQPLATLENEVVW